MPRTKRTTSVSYAKPLGTEQARADLCWRCTFWFYSEKYAIWRELRKPSGMWMLMRTWRLSVRS